MSKDKPVYMVRLETGTLADHRGKIKVWCIGLECPDPDHREIYDSFEELPKWMQRKITVLDMMQTQRRGKLRLGGEKVEGVGTAFGDSYQIIKDEEDENDE